MEISISIEQAIEPLAVTRSKGKIDVSNFLDVVTKVLYHLKKGERRKRDNLWIWFRHAQPTDDAIRRVNGQNQHCHIVCNPVYSFYRTLPTKERLAVLGVPRNGRKRTFRLNAQALGYLKNVKLPRVTLPILQNG